jgi:hypothetical protein
MIHLTPPSAEPADMRSGRPEILIKLALSLTSVPVRQTRGFMRMKPEEV